MSDALIASLQRRVDDLTAQNATLSAEAKDRRIAGKKLKAELEALKATHGQLAKDFDELKGKATAAPSEKDAKIAELEGKLLARDHKDAFAGVAEFKVKGQDGQEADYTLRKGVSVEALWTNLQYKAEGETPDAAKISGLLAGAVATHPYLFEPKPAQAAEGAPGGANGPIVTGRREAGPGAGKGVSNNSQPASVAAQVDATYGSRREGRIA